MSLSVSVWVDCDLWKGQKSTGQVVPELHPLVAHIVAGITSSATNPIAVNINIKLNIIFVHLGFP